MAKLKQSEALTVEREREIQQASALLLIFFSSDAAFIAIRDELFMHILKLFV